MLKLAPVLFLYNIAIYAAFVGIYRTIGFRDNFNIPDKTDDDVFATMYFAWITHVTVGYGDIYPTTGIARALVVLHTALAWLTAAAIFSFDSETSSTGQRVIMILISGFVLALCVWAVVKLASANPTNATKNNAPGKKAGKKSQKSGKKSQKSQKPKKKQPTKKKSKEN